MTIDDIIKEMADETGQVRRDIDRLYGSATDSGTEDQVIWVGGEQVAVRISPKFTKYFGVVPIDVSLSRVPLPSVRAMVLETVDVTKELQDQGLSNFVALGIGYTEKEISNATDLVTSALGLKKKSRP